MATRREWLMTQTGINGKPLAKPGRGKFSNEAKAALAKAEANGMTFDEPIPGVATVSTPKQVITHTNTRTSTPNVPADNPIPKRVIPAAKPRVREQDEAWIVSKAPADAPHLTPHPIAFGNCGKCKERIGWCRCNTGPVAPKWVNGVEGEPLLFTKPAL